MTYKSYNDIKSKLDEARNEFGADKFIEGEAKGIDKGKLEEKIEMVKEMLKENFDINMIVKVSKLTKKEILKIQKDIGL